VCKKINRSHTHTPTENITPDTDTHAHDKNNTPNPQTNTSHTHLTTLEGGATTVRATSHARVGGRAEVSVAAPCRRQSGDFCIIIRVRIRILLDYSHTLLKPIRAYSPLGHHQRCWWPSGEYTLLGFNKLPPVLWTSVWGLFERVRVV